MAKTITWNTFRGPQSAVTADDGYAVRPEPVLLPLTTHPCADGAGYELRDPGGPVYRASTEVLCGKWLAHRDKWFHAGRDHAYKSRYLDHCAGQLLFGKGGSPYGVDWGRRSQ